MLVLVAGGLTEALLPVAAVESRNWPAESSSPHLPVPGRHQGRRRPWRRQLLPTVKADLWQQLVLRPDPSSRLRNGTATGRHRGATEAAACRSRRAAAAVREGSTMAVAAAVARRLPTMIPTTTIASVRRGEMEAAAVVGESVIVTTTITTRTIIEIPMIGIIEMATDTEIAEAEAEGGPAAVGAEVILAADRIKIGAGRLGMSVGIGNATATTAGGNDQDPGPGRPTTEGRGIGTEMVADLRAMAIRIAEAGGGGVVVRPTDGKSGIKNDTAAGNKERRRAMRLAGGIAVTMIRQGGIVIVTDTARRLSVMVRVKKGIGRANVGGVDREADLAKEEREIEWRKAKRRKNVEYNNKYSSAWE